MSAMLALTRNKGRMTTPRPARLTDAAAVFLDVDATSTALDHATTAATQTPPEASALLITLTVIYIIIFVAGILGNLSTCFVIYRNRRMHTATKFYLFSLAVSGLILLVCGLPLEIQRLHNPNYYPMGEAICITLGLASETSSSATILTITAFTYERYIEISKPFCAHAISKLTRALRFIVVIWVVAVGNAVPQAMQYGLVKARENGVDSLQCKIQGEGIHKVFVVSSVIFFGVPMTVIIVFYALIGLKLRTSRILHPAKNISVESERHNTNIASQNRMLGAVTLVFLICWAPFHGQRLLAMYGMRMQSPSDIYYRVYNVLNYLSCFLYYLSTALLSTVFYNVSNKFRNGFKLTLATWRQQDGGPRLWHTYSSLMAHPQEQVGSAVMQRMRERRVARRLAELHTGSTQLCEACAQLTLATWRQQDGGPRLWHTYSSLMAHPQEQVGSAVMQRMRERRVARRLAELHTGSTQLCEACAQLTLATWRQQDGGPRLWHTYSSLMAHPQEQVGSAVMQRMRERRVARRLAELHTGSTQLCEACAQLFDGDSCLP